MGIEIVKFKESDLDTVYEIQRAAYQPLFEKYQDKETSPYTELKEKVLEKYTRAGTCGYLFLKDQIPVGAVRVNIIGDNQTGRISALGVRPEYQGQGIAQQALLDIEEIYKEVKHWILDTILQEAGNCHLYEKLGYVRTGKTEAVNENMTLVFYEKKKF